MDAVTIAAHLRELSVYLGLERDPHRARAYEGAAKTVEAIHDLERRIAAGTLTELPGVGNSVAAVITELHRTGAVSTLDRLRAAWPRMIVELAQLPGVGSKKARVLVEQLGPGDLDELATMAEAGRVREVPGFGPVSERKLLVVLRERHARRGQWLLHDARRLSRALADYLANAPAAVAVHVCGDTRRWIEIVEELVVVVASDAPAAIRAHLQRYPLVLDVVDGSDAQTCVVRLAQGGVGRVVIVPPNRVGAAQLIATGSLAHVAQLRARADRDLAALAGSEAEVYAALDLPWLPPEVRDGDGELTGERFDDLVTLADVTGAVHCHTAYSDGKHSIAQMARAAADRNLAFLTITDHSRSASYANGLDDERLRAQWLELAQAQADTPVRLMRGVEADILVDGALDVAPELTDQLEVVIASVHNRHKLDEDAMTRRLVTAMRQPIFKIWGHALGRLLLRREPLACRFDEVLDAIADSRAAIELNGDPHRLDLDPTRARAARARGVRFVLSSDAHSTSGLDALEYAVAMARRARLRPADVLNTRSPDEFLAAVRPDRA